MSNPIININFKELKYNLYEILGLSKEAKESKIKKNFRKLILELHPDKNKEASEELYNHLIIANQVLSDTNLRNKYDEFLDEDTKEEASIGLKKDFKNDTKDLEKMFPKKEEAKTAFQSKINELNKKHGFNEKGEINVMSQYEQTKKNRNSQINIPQEKISNTSDFNYKFDKKKNEGTFDEQIVVSNNTTTLLPYQGNDGLTIIGDYSTLYSEDTVSNNMFTSLDVAFKIQKVNTHFIEKSLDERMKEYKGQTNIYGNRKPNEFSNKKFDEWEN
jgi:hypothetical protein